MHSLVYGNTDGAVRRFVYLIKGKSEWPASVIFYVILRHGILNRGISMLVRF